MATHSFHVTYFIRISLTSSNTTWYPDNTQLPANREPKKMKVPNKMQVKCEPVGLEKAENTELYTYTHI